ncbi:MAG: hypothetical protein ACRC0L_11350 [Angustibacter sp.]
MGIYAQTPGRRTRQVLADLFIIGWIFLAFQGGFAVREAVQGLSRPVSAMTESARSLGKDLGAAEKSAAQIPGVGNEVSNSLRQVQRSNAAVATFGEQQLSAISQLALILGLLTAIIPIAVAVAIWLPIRLRFIRRLRAAQQLIDSAPDLEIFALRALARQPLKALDRINRDPAGSWRRGDLRVINKLAALELRSLGLRPPYGR